MCHKPTFEFSTKYHHTKCVVYLLHLFIFSLFLSLFMVFTLAAYYRVKRGRNTNTFEIEKKELTTEDGICCNIRILYLDSVYLGCNLHVLAAVMQLHFVNKIWQISSWLTSFSSTFSPTQFAIVVFLYFLQSHQKFFILVLFVYVFRLF